MGEIIVADDENKVRNVVANLFEEHKVNIAASWTELLDILDSGKKFDLIITDIVMPGYKEIAVKGIVDVMKKYDTPVIFISGYEEQKLANLPSNMRFIKKPFSIRLMKTYGEKMMGL